MSVWAFHSLVTTWSDGPGQARVDFAPLDVSNPRALAKTSAPAVVMLEFLL